MNQVSLVGRISKAPQLRYTNDGVAYLNFTLAVENDVFNKTTKQYNVDFIDCSIWGKSAENRAPYMLKGSLIAVNGQLRVKMVDRNGVRVAQAVVRCDSTKFLESKQTVENRTAYAHTS